LFLTAALFILSSTDILLNSYHSQGIKGRYKDSEAKPLPRKESVRSIEVLKHTVPCNIKYRVFSAINLHRKKCMVVREGEDVTSNREGIMVGLYGRDGIEGRSGKVSREWDLGMQSVCEFRVV